MAYNITGRSHKEGIENEKNVAAYLNQLIETDPDLIKSAFNLGSIDYVKFEHKGGTKSKSDLDIIDPASGDVIKEISIKKFNESSTFDLINTSKIDEYLSEKAKENYTPLKEYLNEVAGKYKNIDYSAEFEKSEKEKIEKKLELLTSKFLDSITDIEIKKILKHVKDKDCDYLLISKFKKGSSGKENELIDLTIIDTNDRYDYNLYMNSDNITLKAGRGKSSRQILSNEENGGLRIRAVLNNGVTALAGFNWNKEIKNKSSVFTFKLQQDNPQQIIDKSNKIVLP